MSPKEFLILGRGERIQDELTHRWLDFRRRVEEMGAKMICEEEGVKPAPGCPRQVEFLGLLMGHTLGREFSHRAHLVLPIIKDGPLCYIVSFQPSCSFIEQVPVVQTEGGICLDVAEVGQLSPAPIIKDHFLKFMEEKPLCSVYGFYDQETLEEYFLKGHFLTGNDLPTERLRRLRILGKRVLPGFWTKFDGLQGLAY